MSALQFKSALEDPQAEPALAQIAGLGANGTYMLDLDGEIAATHSALVATAVTEIATLRAEWFGPQVG